MKITQALIEKLLKLQGGASIPASALRGEWVEELLRDGVLVSRSHGSRRTISAASPQRLEAELSYLDERLGCLDKMKNLSGKDEINRTEQAFDTGNSKLVKARSCPGFPINSYASIPCLLNGRKFVVHPMEGSFAFVTDWRNFSIPADVVVVGIENMENFRMIRHQRTLFSNLLPGCNLLFVSRYPQSVDLISWLKSLPNRYVHFGDFDLAGIHIFLTEFYSSLGCRAQFLIPSDIETRLRNGSAERYTNQYLQFKNLSSDIPSLQRLIDMINKFHHCYDQEGYIYGETAGEQ